MLPMMHSKVQLIDSKTVAVLRALVEAKDVLYLRECAKLANVAPTTTLRILNQLSSLSIISVQQIKHLKLYSFADTQTARDVRSLFEMNKWCPSIVQLIDKKTVAVLRALVEADDVLYLRECAKLAKVPPTTTLRILNQLSLLSIISVKQIKHLKLYALADTDTARDVRALFHKVKA